MEHVHDLYVLTSLQHGHIFCQDLDSVDNHQNNVASFLFLNWFEILNSLDVSRVWFMALFLGTVSLSQ